MSEWQTIDSAPRDGTRILAVNSNGDMAVIFWNGSGWMPSFSVGTDMNRMWNDDSGEFWSGAARHWMPLPAPPS